MTATLYGNVTFTVQVAFDTADPLTTSPTWTDVTAYVLEVTTRRGRWDRLTQRYDAGTCVVKFDNSDRRFDPLYSSGPYYGDLVPMKQLRVRAEYASTTYEVWRGFVQGWPQEWDPNFPTWSTCTVTAVDAFGYLATIQLPDRYAMEVQQDSPSGYWRCGDTGAVLTDSTVNANHGSWSAWTSQVDSGLAGVTDGGARRVEPNQDPITATFTLPDLTGGFVTTGSQITGADATLEAWCYFTSGTQGYVTTAHGSGASLGFGFNYPYEGAGDLFNVWVLSEDGTNEQTWFLQVPVGQWVHIVLTYDFSPSTTLTAYINGVAYTSSWSFAEQWTTGLQLDVQNMTGDRDPDSYFVVDEIATYNSLLSAARITAHYLAGFDAYLLERSGTRVGAILDYCDWPSGLRSLGSGDSWLDSGPLGGSTALDYLQRIADTEQGRLYVDASGNVVFRDRTWDIETTSARTSQATFGDSGSELRYARLGLDGGNIEQIVNTIEVTPQTGATVTVQDAASVTAYGRRVESLQSLHTNSSDAGNLGAWRVDRFADPSYVVTELEFHPRRAASTMWAQALGRDIGDRVTVVRRPQGVGSAISQERSIEGIEHTITPNNWTTRFFLAEPIPTRAEANWWVVGNATYGQVGTAAVPY